MAHQQITSAGPIEQVFALTNSDPVDIVPPAFEVPLTGTTLKIDLNEASLLIISFNARVFGLTSDPNKTDGPFLALKCTVDGNNAEPNVNSIEHYAIPGTGHSQAFTWIAHSLNEGPHTVEILATGINFSLLPNQFESIVVTNRSLVAMAARLSDDATGT